MDTSLTRWRGRIALITGGSSGIGRAIAVDLAKLGMKVAVTARRSVALEETVAAIENVGASALALWGDQRDPAVNRRFFTELAARWGPPDVLINNAGTLGARALLEGDWDEIQSALDLNIRASLLCMREAAAAMQGKAEGAIINLSSMTGHRVVPGTPALYAATKHALRLLTDGVRNELAARGGIIKVALISPGLVDTPWHRKSGGLLQQQSTYPYPPLEPADIASAVRYILAAPPGVQVCDILLRPSAQTF